MRLRVFLCFAVLVVFSLANAADRVRIEKKVVEIGGGRSMWMQVGGTGGPTVILESGFGDSHQTWDRIFLRIAEFTRVASYDRAGYGDSPKSSEPRSYEAVAKDLRAMLQAAKVPGPYVLVGHSYGGAIIRAYAHLYPNEVSGFVFVDPMCEDAIRAIPEEEMKSYEAEDAAEMANWLPGQKGEGDFLAPEEDNDYPILRSYGKPIDVPMILLVAGRNRPTNWARSLLNQYGQWMIEASESEVRYVSSSRHYMQADEPDLVVSSIQKVVFPDALRELRRFAETASVDETVARYRVMKKRWPKDRMKESVLNTLGYDRLRAKDAEGAVRLFELNVSLFPKSSNAYDSLGEGYRIAGKKELAIKNYKKSLHLNPNNTNAQKMLKELGV